MPYRESVITHLQIIHTWASYAREHNLYFFTMKHMDSIIAWTDEALALLKEQDNCENCAIAIEDRQPVVRCKDCKHYDSFSQECRDGIDGIMTPNFYCGNAERKEGR